MSQKLPLTGIRVLELGAYISGPYAGTLLSALGADVVKVEPPKGGDAFRRNSEVSSPYFVQYNAGKRSLAVDLKRAEGRQLVRDLIPRFDVVIENSRPGKMAVLGLGPEDCRALNEQIVYASVSGFGDGGPLRDRAAYDTMGQSMAGFYSIMNDPQAARLTGTCIADLLTGIINAFGIVAALVGRERTDRRTGCVVQTSLMEAMSSVTIDAMTQMFEMGAAPTRQTRHPQAQNFCLLTASGGSITLHLSSSEKFWQSLAGAMDRTDLLEDSRFTRYGDRLDNFWELKPIVEAEFLKRSREEWEQRLIEFDVPFAPVLTIAEVAEHAQTRWLDLLEPERDGNTLVRPPMRFNGKRPERPVPAPYIGQHSIEVAGEVRSGEDIADLIRAGVVFQSKAETTNTRDALRA